MHAKITTKYKVQNALGMIKNPNPTSLKNIINADILLKSRTSGQEFAKKYLEMIKFLLMATKS